MSLICARNPSKKPSVKPFVPTRRNAWPNASALHGSPEEANAGRAKPFVSRSMHSSRENLSNRVTACAGVFVRISTNKRARRAPMAASCGGLDARKFAPTTRLFFSSAPVASPA